MTTKNIIHRLLIILLALTAFSCDPDPELGTDPENASGEAGQASSTCELTSFSFNSKLNDIFFAGSAAGVIDGTKITIPVQYNIFFNRLVASFETTGKTVSVNGTAQESGVTKNDFTKPLVYTVTAEDGSEKQYTIILQSAAEDASMSAPSAIGEKASLKINANEFDGEPYILNMIYANDTAGIKFPSGANDIETTLNSCFWMAETEFALEEATLVLTWAVKNGKFSDDPAAHNYVSKDSNLVKYGGVTLIDSMSAINMSFNGVGFGLNGDYGMVPIRHISFAGAVMLCNWMTEMRDGNADNCVYSGITENWDVSKTKEDISKTGYRLPSNEEWQFAARYRGDHSTAFVGGYSNPYFTPAGIASGADSSGADETHKLAQFWSTSSGSVIASVKSHTANALGIYDMSGNVEEMCWTVSSTGRYAWGGSFNNTLVSDIAVDANVERAENACIDITGFRICRSAN